MSFDGFIFIPDTPEVPAVVLNSDKVAEQLGYSDVSQVLIAKLIVFHDGVKVFEDEVGEGKYRSAVFVEAWMAYRGKSRREAKWIDLDDVALTALRAYMGEKVWEDAGNEYMKGHGFVRAIRAGVGKKIQVMVHWKTRQALELNQVGQEI